MQRAYLSTGQITDDDPHVLSTPLAAGQVVRVLPEQPGEAGPISAVYLEGRVLPRKVRALIDFAAEDIRAADIL